MTTPKQKRPRGREQPDQKQFAPFEPVLLDGEFDQMEQANAEWSNWRWPELRDE